MSIPNTQKRFLKWLDKRKVNMAPHVYETGLDYHFYLGLLAFNRNNPHALERAKQITAAPMLAFAEMVMNG